MGKCLRIGLYLGRQSGPGGGMAHYSKELVMGLLQNLSSKGEQKPIELVLYGDAKCFDGEFLRALRQRVGAGVELHQTLGTVFISRPAFRQMQTDSKIRVVVQELPAFGSRYAATLLDQLLLPLLLIKDGIMLLHSTANSGVIFATLPQVVTVHDLFQAWPPQEQKGVWPRLVCAFYRAFFALQFRRCFRFGLFPLPLFVCDSAQVQSEVRQRYGFSTEQVRLVTLGLDSGFLEIRDALRRKAATPGVLSRGPEEGYVFVFSSSDPRKNTVRILNAWQELSCEEKELGLFVKCSGEEQIAWTKTVLSERGSLANIHFAGWLSREELLSAYLRASVLCVASLREGFGFPALEALCLGKHVVSAELEVFEDCVSVRQRIHVCDPFSKQSIASALSRGISAAKKESAKKERGEEVLEAQTAWRTMDEVSAEMFEIYWSELGAVNHEAHEEHEGEEWSL